MRRRKVLSLIASSAVVLIAACQYGPGYGPPPHAPAHGRRRKMTWDPTLGVYVVVGMPGVYYLEPYYYRAYRGAWQRSQDLNRWHSAPKRRLPPGLAKKR
jgi:hypothetical protein